MLPERFTPSVRLLPAFQSYYGRSIQPAFAILLPEIFELGNGINHLVFLALLSFGAALFSSLSRHYFLNTHEYNMLNVVVSNNLV